MAETVDLSQFDIRNMVRGSENQKKVFQDRYDAVNRIVTFLWDIPFQDLFGRPWRELMPELQKNVGRTVPGFLQEDTLVTEALQCLQERLPDWTLGECGSMALQVQDGRGHAIRFVDPLRFVDERLRALRASGIHLAYASNAAQRAAQRYLLEHAGDMSYCQIYLRAQDSVSKETVDAVHAAQRAGLLLYEANDYCCQRMPDGTKECVYVEGSGLWCSCAVSSGGSTPGPCPAVDQVIDCTHQCCVGSQRCP